MTMGYRRAGGLTLLVLACGVSLVQAHHSFVATYDLGRPTRIAGRLTQFDWANPHCKFVLEAQSGDGQVATWTFEGGSPVTLSRRGLRRGDLQAGDSLIVEGYQARSGKRLVDAQRITLPDGRVFDVGTPGHGSSGMGRTPAPGEPRAAARQ
jgi:hypothetical protein